VYYTCYNLSGRTVGIVCGDEFRPPVGVFPLEYKKLVEVIVEQLNKLDPKGDLIHNI
jgi:hypothetical protein